MLKPGHPAPQQEDAPQGQQGKQCTRSVQDYSLLRLFCSGWSLWCRGINAGFHFFNVFFFSHLSCCKRKEYRLHCFILNKDSMASAFSC